MRGEHLRALLALLVLGVCLRLMVDLLTTPRELYSIQAVMAGSWL